MPLLSFANGDQLIRQDNAIIARLNGARQVLSTAPHLGGYQEDLRWIFNYDCTLECQDLASLEALDYAAHMARVAQTLGLSPEQSAGIMTTAAMEHAAICTRTYHDTTVTAVVTAGIDINGGRAGDPAGWHESEDGFIPVVGTINILLFISANLTAGALARALVTCTEAKAAALQELQAPSRYSSGIATGSGTDGTIIMADAESSVHLREAGLHSKLGELIGRTVMTAVKEALFRQTGLNAARQFSVLARMERFGLAKDSILAADGHAKAAAAAKLVQIDKEPCQVVLASLYAHLVDQLLWNLIGPEEARQVALSLLSQMDFTAEGVEQPAGDSPDLSGCENRQTAEHLVELFRRGLGRRVLQD